MRIALSTKTLVATVAVTFSLCLANATATSAEPAKPIAGIGPTGPPVQVHSGLRFTEGPAADAKGDLYFTDAAGSKILRVNAGGDPIVIIDASQGANGLMFDGKGRLLGCQAATKSVVAVDVNSKEITVVTDNCDGAPYTMPNDLVIDRQGGVYFTDPNFLGTKDRKSAVYFCPAGGKAVRLLEDLILPNGILLSPDEKTLYVLPFGAEDVMAYPIESPGKLGAGRSLCKLPQPDGQKNKGGDGICCDTKGNLYVAAPSVGSIVVISPEGKTLGLIPVPKAPSNCDFGGPDMKTLYVTARDSVYSFPMEAVGHRFGGKAAKP